MAAPTEIAISHSNTDASKLGEATWRVRECAVSPKRSSISWVRSDTPLCVTGTPFGRPVDPEV